MTQIIPINYGSLSNIYQKDVKLSQIDRFEKNSFEALIQRNYQKRIPFTIVGIVNKNNSLKLQFYSGYGFYINRIKKNSENQTTKKLHWFTLNNYFEDQLQICFIGTTISLEDIKKNELIYKILKSSNPERTEYAQILYEISKQPNITKEQSKNWKRLAAIHNHSKALYELGMMYINGKMHVQDSEQAILNWKQAAEQGYIPAKLELLKYISNSKSKHYDPQLTLKWFNQIRETSPKSEKLLKKTLENSNIIECIYQQAIDKVAVAQYIIGICHKNGYVYKQSHINSLEWFRKAGDNGYIEGWIKLGNAYYKGLGVDQSDINASVYYKKASRKNHPKALYMMGILLLKGFKLIYVDSTAIDYFKQSSDLGFHKASYKLAECYEFGIHTKVDMELATCYYFLAAERGNLEALFKMGCILQNRKLYPEALNMYSKAASRKHSQAAHMLGLFYSNGWGTEKSMDKAHYWFQKAKDLSVVKT